jgi:hypothetical protein
MPSSSSSSVLMYSFEAWIMSLIGLGWLSIRWVFQTRSLLEEYLIYSACIASTMSLVFNGVGSTHNANCKAFFSLHLLHWVLGVYIAAESFYFLSFPMFDSPVVFINATNITNAGNITLPCCPNDRPELWTRQIYFEGLSVYLIPLAITMAFQTIHLVVAAAALTNTQATLWPGSCVGYFMIHVATVQLYVKFIGSGILTPPCPTTTITILGNWITFELKLVLMVFGGAFALIGAVESIVSSHFFPRLVWNILGLGVVGIYGFSVYINLSDTNIITYPWAAFNGFGLLCILASFVESSSPMIIMAVNQANSVMRTPTQQQPTHQPPHQAPQRHPFSFFSLPSYRHADPHPTAPPAPPEPKPKSRSRFVLPIDTKNLYPTRAAGGGGQVVMQSDSHPLPNNNQQQPQQSQQVVLVGNKMMSKRD